MRLGDSAIVVAVEASDAVGTRILEMGVTPGVTVRLAGISPFGDPLELEVCGYRLSLRRTEAARVLVERSSASLDRSDTSTST